MLKYIIFFKTCGKSNEDKFLKTFIYGTNLSRDLFKEYVFESNIPIVINYNTSEKIKSALTISKVFISYNIK